MHCQERLDWIEQCLSVLRPRQHSIGYMGDEKEEEEVELDVNDATREQQNSLSGSAADRFQ